jgi:hypothetical protein
VETAAWAALAILKAGLPEHPALIELLDFIQKSKTNYGGFGSTQATVMALKALKLFHLSRQREVSSGQVIVQVNGHADTLSFDEQTYRRLYLDLAPHFVVGTNFISIRQVVSGKPMPFTVQANWRSLQLPETAGVPLSLRTRLSAGQAKVGDFVRYYVELRNETGSPVNAPLAIVGIPAGLSLQSWQLRELEKQRTFDYFEIKDNYLVAYYEKMAPGEVRHIQLDLKADTAGSFQSPASLVYPYYTAEAKYWQEGEAVIIHPF